MDPNTRQPPYFYDTQGNLPHGIVSKPSTVNIADVMTSSYSAPMGGLYTLPVAAPPSLSLTPTPGSSDVMTLTVHCSMSDIVIAVSRHNWQCYMCSESHSLDTSIDKHISTKHHGTMGISTEMYQGGDNSHTQAQLHTPTSHGIISFQDSSSNISVGNQFNVNDFVGQQLISSTAAGNDHNTNVLLATSQALTVPQEQVAVSISNPLHTVTTPLSLALESGTSGRSGLEREVALLMAQTFTQSGAISTWDSSQQIRTQSTLPADENVLPKDEDRQVMTELTVVRKDAQTTEHESSSTDDVTKGVILGKMINKVEKAIPSVADTDAKNGLFQVATELAKMKKQTKSRRQILREKYRYFTCTECGKEVRNRKSYIVQHNRSHVKGKNFNCLVCNKMFKYKSTLRRHVKDQGHDGGMEDDSVALPSTVSQIESSGVSQDNSSTVDSFHHSNAEFQTEDVRKDNGVSSSRPEKDTSDCLPDEFIPQGLPAYQKILSGLLVKGEQARSSTGKKLTLVQCFVCDREIRNRNYYITRHARCHMQDVLYTCTICSMQFFRRDYFKQHIQQHEIPGVCDNVDSKDGILEDSIDTKDGILSEHAGQHIILDEIPNLPHSASDAPISLAAVISTITNVTDAPSSSAPPSETNSSVERAVSKNNTVPCKICGKEIVNSILSIKHHAQEHSMMELENILNKQDHNLDIHEECHPILRVVGSPASPRLKINISVASPITKGAPHKYRCHVCNKQFKSYVKKRRHVMEHGTTFTCTACWMKFDGYTQYRVHQQACRKTLSTIDDEGGSYQHRCKEAQRISARDKFMCLHCGAYIINTKQNIARHMRELHSEGQLHNCNKCNRAYDSYHKLQRHVKSHGDKGGICDVCGKVFLTKQALRRHTKLHTGPEGMYQCPRCPKSFRFQGLLDRHMRKHKEDTETCPHCGKVYISKVHMQRHITVIHLGVKDYKFKCEQCGAQFFESIQLRDHVAYRHHGIQLYTCKFCSKGFNCRPTMVRHERKMHTNYLPYVCAHCGQGFPEKSKLVSHEMTHTGVSPHKCEVCGKYFTTGSALKTHKNLHLGLKPYGCSVCGRSYIKRWHLQQHLRKSHNTMGLTWQEITQPPDLQTDDHLVIQPGDEALSLHQGDSHITLHQADGHLTIQQGADGQITVHEADGRITVHQTDTRLTLQPDRHLMLHQTDPQLVHQTGAQLIHRSDAQLLHQGNGQLIVQQADGHISVHQSLEHITVQHTNIVYQ